MHPLNAFTPMRLLKLGIAIAQRLQQHKGTLSDYFNIFEINIHQINATFKGTTMTCFTDRGTDILVKEVKSQNAHAPISWSPLFNSTTERFWHFQKERAPSNVGSLEGTLGAMRCNVQMLRCQ